MNITVFPFYFANFFNSDINKNAVKLSNPEVGSSNIKTFGFVTSSNPIEVLFLSPPEIPCI